MMRVPWGGSEALWHGAALRLRQEGHTISICVKGRAQLAKPIADLKSEGVPLCLHHPVGVFGSTFRRLRKRVFPAWSQHAEIRAWLRHEKPDLACVSGGNFKDGLWVLEILKELGIPFTAVVQANAEWLWPADPERERLVAVYQQAAGIFCVSQGNLNLLETQLATPLPQAEVIRNPFNVEWDQPETWPTEDLPLRLACVGRLEPDAKGQDLIIASLARPEWRMRDVRVSFYGKGASEAGLKALVAKHGLQERVIFAGQTNDIASLWAEHHALLMPSRYEGLPLALVEAMLCGRPAVVTDVAGHCEMVTDGVEGFVADGPQHKLWHQAMERMWQNRADLAAMGRAARERARQTTPSDPCAVFADKLLQLCR